MSITPPVRTADAWGHIPEPMVDLSPYMDDAKILTVMARSGLHEGVLPALLRIIDQRFAELTKDSEPIIG